MRRKINSALIGCGAIGFFNDFHLHKKGTFSHFKSFVECFEGYLLPSVVSLSLQPQTLYISLKHIANKILSISLFSTSLCLQPLHSNQKSSHTLRYALLRHPPSVGSLWKRTTSSSIDYRLTTERVLSTITAGVLTLCLV